MYYCASLLGHFSGCGINDDVTQWMDSVQNNAEHPDNHVHGVPPKPATLSLKSTGSFLNRSQLDAETLNFRYPHEKYSKAANWQSAEDEIIDESKWHANAHERVRRATRSKEENKNTCSLYIQTDPLIWRHIREGIADVSIFKIHSQFYLFHSSHLQFCTARSRQELGSR